MKMVLAFLFLASVAFYQNCNQMTFTNENPSLVQQDLGPTICDPFGSNSSSDSKSGLAGRIRYMSPSNNRDWLKTQTVYDYYDPAKSFDLGFALVMRDVNVPPRKFNTGFPIGNGQYVHDSSGNLIKEWFSIKLEGFIRLRSGEGEGAYRLAIESDDGSIVQIKNANDSDYITLIDNNKMQAPFLKTADQNVTMTRDKMLPIRIWYYQGPAEDIALRLFWRRDDNNDSLRVLTSENFVLPDGIVNPCVGQ